MIGVRGGHARMRHALKLAKDNDTNTAPWRRMVKEIKHKMRRDIAYDKRPRRFRALRTSTDLFAFPMR